MEKCIERIYILDLFTSHNGYKHMLSLKMLGLVLPMMLKKYGMNYVKRYINREQTNLMLREDSIGD